MAVNPGCTYSGNIVDPNCDPAGWTYRRLMNGTVTTTKPNQQQNDNGYILTGGILNEATATTLTDGGNLNLNLSEHNTGRRTKKP